MPDETKQDRRDLIRVGPHVSPVAGYAVPHASGRNQDSVGLNVLTAALWRRKVLIAGAAMAGLLAGLAIALLTTPKYRARASLQLEGFNNDQFLSEVGPISPSVPNASPDNYLQNAVKLLESETLAKRVAGTLGIQARLDPPAAQSGLRAQLTRWARFANPTPLTAEERVIRTVQKSLTVRTSLQSQVIEIFYEARDAHLAAQGANATASEFVEFNREARWQLAQDTTEWLNKQAASLKSALENSNQQLEDFARSAGLVFAGKPNTLAEDRMRQIQEALAKAEADRAAKQARFEAAQANADALSSDPQTAGPLQQDQADLDKLRRELAQLQTLYTSTSYRVQRVQAEITETEKAVERERRDALARLRTEYVTAATMEQFLTRAEAYELKAAEHQMENERLYNLKKTEVEATQRLYEAMLQKVKEAGAASSLRTTNVRIIDAADVPSVPYTPNPQLNMALGLAIGAVGGIGIALLRAGSDNRVKYPGELSLPEIPELGVIPSAQLGGALIPGDRHTAWFKGAAREFASPGRDRETSLWNESFRAVLTSILFSETFGPATERRDGGRVLVVTSVDVMEGKTLVLTNLGIAAAETKRRVLLIDADLRRPRLHHRLEVSNERGLTDSLRCRDFAESGNFSLDALIQPTRTPNLWVLPSGPVDDTTSELLYAHSSNLANIFRRFRKDFDLVLIDTPPIMFCADGRLLGRTSDGLVMVVRANRRRREELRAAYLQFARDQVPVIGTILNDWKMDSNQIRSFKRYRVHYSSRSS